MSDEPIDMRACECLEIQRKDARRHFSGCPLRKPLPEDERKGSSCEDEQLTRCREQLARALKLPTDPLGSWSALLAIAEGRCKLAGASAESSFGPLGEQLAGAFGNYTGDDIARAAAAYPPFAVDVLDASRPVPPYQTKLCPGCMRIDGYHDPACKLLRMPLDASALVPPQWKPKPMLPLLDVKDTRSQRWLDAEEAWLKAHRDGDAAKMKAAQEIIDAEQLAWDEANPEPAGG